MSVVGTVRAAAIQMNSGADVQQNLQTIDGLLEDAASRGVAIAFLPENLAIMGVRDEDKLQHAENPGSGPIQEFLADAAKRHKLWVVAGSLPLRSAQEGKCYGASIVYDSNGVASHIYRKIHLFDVDLPGRDERYRESDTMDFGSDHVVIPSPLGQLGLSICYDLRFPQLYRTHAHAGAVVLSAPAAFTRQTGEAHWHVLQRARAIENGAFMLSAAQAGRHGDKRETYGHSIVVSPWGEVLAEADGETPQVVLADIDPALAAHARARIPALKNERAFADPKALQDTLAALRSVS